MLKQLFSSRVRVKLLTIFLTNPDARFYTRELSRLLDESPYAVQRELRRLKSVGLLEVEPEANIKYYAVDKSCPIYPELKSIVLKTTGLGPQNHWPGGRSARGSYQAGECRAGFRPRIRGRWRGRLPFRHRPDAGGRGGPTRVVRNHCPAGGSTRAGNQLHGSYAGGTVAEDCGRRSIH